MPDWKVTLLTVIITTAGLVLVAIAGKIVAPTVAKFLRRGRDDVEIDQVEAKTENVDAQTEKLKAETRILEIQEVETRITAMVDDALLGVAELSEQQRSEIVDLRNQVKELRLQVSVMNETINTQVAFNRKLEADNRQCEREKAEIHAANLRLLQQVEVSTE